MRKFKSPVYPIPPSFDSNQKLELNSTKSYLDFIKDNGASIVMTTAGTSQYNLMNLDEIRQFNDLVCTFEGEKIIGLPPLSTVHLLEEIKLLNNKYNTDNISLLILFPDRYYNDDQIVDFFESICLVSKFPILVHGNVLKKGMGGSYEYSKPLLERLSNIDGFIGMKEEAGNMMHSTTNIPTKLEVIVAGGSMKRFWALEPHGATTYLAGVGSFNPNIEEKFFDYYINNEFGKAKYIIESIETPLFDIFMEFGWHLSMRESLKYMGYIRENRAPFNNITNIQKEIIINTLNKVI